MVLAVFGREVEVFPRQDRVGVDGFGNRAILPLAGKCAADVEFGRRGVVVKRWEILRGDVRETLRALEQAACRRASPVRPTSVCATTV